MSVDETVSEAATAIVAGGVGIIATDTVYGLVASAANEAAVRRIYSIKRRPQSMPLSLLALDIDTLYSALPDLVARQRTAIAALLPGPFTLVVDDLADAFVHLRGDQEALGVRVPVLRPNARAVVNQTGVLASTSANLHGGPDAASVGDLAPAVVSSADTLIDEGPLPGLASTVVDVTGTRPAVLRAGAVSAADALARLESVFDI